MIFKNLDVKKLSRLSSQQVDHVTCMECCKYYVIPTTAACGHTLCHSCWRGRQTCPCCSVQVDKRNLKLNLPLQSLKDHIQLLASAFEELFKIKLEEFTLDPPLDKEFEDSNKHVKEWLASSQNHFSAPVTDSQQSIIGLIKPVEHVTSSIQIHSEKKENPKSIEVVHIPPLQVDWDKIEEMPEIDNSNKNEQNPVGPMDIEPFEFLDDDKDYSTENPRRSSRNKENKNSHRNKLFTEMKSDKNSGKDSNLDSDNKTHKHGKNWNNVKRMKKEFSKLNKKNRNKLNVSIEMCKKNQIIANKAVAPNSEHNILYEIDDNTPKANLNDKNTDKSNNDIEEETEEVSTESNKQKDIRNNYSNNSKHSIKAQSYVNVSDKPAEDVLITKIMCKDNAQNETIESQKVCFFKKSALNKVETLAEKKTDIGPNENFKAVSTTVCNDDIEITIKIGSTLTNICIKKKNNDVLFKVNSDREIQTSLENVNANNKIASCSPITDNKVQNNIVEEMQTDTVHDDVVIKCTTSKTQIVEKSTSVKKNTASADTATGNFEITESVERELTDMGDNAQFNNEKNKKISSNHSVCGNNSQTKTQPPVTQKELQGIDEEMEYLNDLDIFDGESVKEGRVQTLKASKNTPSAILMPSLKSNVMKSLKDKRERESCTDNLPSNKKMKLTLESTNTNDKPNTLTNEKNKIVDQDSENMNYDAIMSQVFANIDADMGKLTKTTDHKQATQNPSCIKNKISESEDISHKTQDNNGNKHNNSNKHFNTEYANQKCSENIFSMFDKEISDSEILLSSKNKTSTQIHRDNEESMKAIKTDNVDNVISENIKSLSQASEVEVVDLSTPQHNDDSDKSIVEETPQKTTSFSKNKNKNETTMVGNTQEFLNNNKKNLKHKAQNDVRDTEEVLSLSDNMGDTRKTSKNVTIVETVPPRPTLETPLTITKFVDQIKHKSTPMARKSLNFNSQNAEEDPEHTLCPSSFVAAKTTQEKEFLQRAFDQTQNSPIQSLNSGKNNKEPAKLCVAGSCLSSSENANLKLLCLRRNWTFVDKYCKELTHLVVGVDEENKSQRSVKYMCALAGSKWIVSYKWVERCLQTNSIVDENYQIQLTNQLSQLLRTSCCTVLPTI